MYKVWSKKLYRDYHGNLESFCYGFLVPLIEGLSPEFASRVSLEAATYLSSKNAESQLVELIRRTRAKRHKVSE